MIYSKSELKYNCNDCVKKKQLLVDKKSGIGAKAAKWPVQLPLPSINGHFQLCTFSVKCQSPQSPPPPVLCHRKWPISREQVAFLFSKTTPVACRAVSCSLSLNIWLSLNSAAASYGSDKPCYWPLNDFRHIAWPSRIVWGKSWLGIFFFFFSCCADPGPASPMWMQSETTRKKKKKKKNPA